MEKLKVLIVEDQPHFAHVLSKKLQSFCETDLATHKNQALHLLDLKPFDVLLVDLNLTHQQDLHGLSILNKAKSLGLYSIVLSELEEASVTREAYEAGCDHFLSKLFFETSLIPYLQNYQKNKDNDSKLKQLQQSFVSHDPKFLRSLKNLFKLNLKNRCLHLTGETGVGKSYFAKTFHELMFPGTPFVSFNCSQVPESLIDSELFGHKKGAFTGAEKDYTGLLERSDGGTLFLDEIGTMPLYTQQKLLKAIEEKEFTPLGCEKSVKVDFTLVSATCEDLAEKILKKKFRKDFYFRIAGYELEIPALRSRKEDIEVLLYHFISLSPRKFFIEEDVVAQIKEHSWPGNTRELKRLVDTLSNSELGIIKTDCPYLPKLQSIPSHDFLTPEQEEFILNHGLSGFIKNAEQSIFEKIYRGQEGKATKVINKLKISNSSYYRILKESQLTARN